MGFNVYFKIDVYCSVNSNLQTKWSSVCFSLDCVSTAMITFFPSKWSSQSKNKNVRTYVVEGNQTCNQIEFFYKRGTNALCMVMHIGYIRGKVRHLFLKLEEIERNF